MSHSITLARGSLAALAALLAIASSASAADAAHQPDARWRIATTSYFAGDNVYNTSAQGQSETTTAHRGDTATFNLQNDGTASQKLKLKATGANTPGYTVKYRFGSTDITAAVKAGTWKTPKLDHGKTVNVTIKVTVKQNAANNSTFSRLLTVRSAINPDSVDAAELDVSPA
jgi:uncharacterized membrane protein